MHHSPDRLFDRFYDAFLFDMDGTLLNSIAAAERVWSRWAGLIAEAAAPDLASSRAA